MRSSVLHGEGPAAGPPVNMDGDAGGGPDNRGGAAGGGPAWRGGGGADGGGIPGKRWSGLPARRAGPGKWNDWPSTVGKGVISPGSEVTAIDFAAGLAQVCIVSNSNSARFADRQRAENFFSRALLSVRLHRAIPLESSPVEAFLRRTRSRIPFLHRALLSDSPSTEGCRPARTRSSKCRALARAKEN